MCSELIDICEREIMETRMLEIFHLPGNNHIVQSKRISHPWLLTSILYPQWVFTEYVLSLFFFLWVFFCVCVCVCLVFSLRPTLCGPKDCSLPGSSVHGILQERSLDWVAISFSKGSFQPRDQTWAS